MIDHGIVDPFEGEFLDFDDRVRESRSRLEALEQKLAASRGDTTRP